MGRVVRRGSFEECVKLGLMSLRGGGPGVRRVSSECFRVSIHINRS